jgi:CheY-like chemotaxis protein
VGAPRATQVRISNPDGEGELIMLVDDDDYVTLLAERILTGGGYRVVTARDGFQALELYKRLADQVDLVILDFMMPGMDGGTIFSRMRMINPGANVVVSSGFATPEKLKGLEANGLRGFMPKPHTQKKLLLQVRATLDAIRSESRK